MEVVATRSSSHFELRAQPVRVALSYRREDETEAGVVYNAFSARLGKGRVFQDNRSIPPGHEWRITIAQNLQRADVLIALIGTNWIGRNASSPADIHREDDPVRTELELGIQHRMRVVPVLLPGAVLPSLVDLPASLAPLLDRQATQLEARDIEASARQLAQLVCGKRWWQTVGVVLFFCLGTALLLHLRFGPKATGSEPTVPDPAPTSHYELIMPVKRGDAITEQHVRAVQGVRSASRPWDFAKEIRGGVFARDLGAGSPLTWDDILLSTNDLNQQED